MNTGRGQNGPDAQWIGEPADNPGFDFAELKPNTSNGMKQFNSQMDAWHNIAEGPIQEGKALQLFGYDEGGNILSTGQNFTAQGDAWAGSLAPGFGPGQTLVPGIPNSVWGFSGAAFGGMMNSNYGTRGCG